MHGPAVAHTYCRTAASQSAPLCASLCSFVCLFVCLFVCVCRSACLDLSSSRNESIRFAELEASSAPAGSRCPCVSTRSRCERSTRSSRIFECHMSHAIINMVLWHYRVCHSSVIACVDGGRKRFFSFSSVSFKLWMDRGGGRYLLVLTVLKYSIQPCHPLPCPSMQVGFYLKRSCTSLQDRQTDGAVQGCAIGPVSEWPFKQGVGT